MSVFDDVLSAFGITASNLLKAVDPTATPTNVAATDATTAGATILTKIVGGQTIVPFTSSNSAWTIPLGVTRMFAGVINGGNKGTTGSTSTGGTAAGGTGGLDGGYIWGELTVSSIVAATGTLITGVSNTSGIDRIEGSYLTSSQPGQGGNGGQANSATPAGSAGTSGTSSRAGIGGAGGAGRNTSGTATAGGNGVNGTSTAPVYGGSGGGGGGGAAGSTASTYTGGQGGDGGFPGGGSGGGGGAAGQQAIGTKTGGAPGTPGNGLVVIVYQ
jgi:hypothetical protein